ncbi:HD domain-containing protein [Melghirimyces algeriensis]|uniref:HD domain-containing protein n=1 Tax=Melghirimyces algeriensis TaxID=910412 RepID=A0A521BNX8_9BACL|nr:HD domain-containing protein [Melghirimyces algeriensis]SMO48848.1 HD domain-containing protein [Melghirimyces algeriensis]
MNPVFPIPDSELAQKATHYAKELSSPALFNHLIRTYAFGYAVGQKANLTLDSELFYLGAVLHDLGLTEPFKDGERPFEVEGGAVAHTFLTKQGYPMEKADAVKEAIELHASVKAEEKQPEIALVHIGVMVDAGLRMDSLTEHEVRQIIEEYPRLGIQQAMIEAFTYQIKQKNDTRLLQIIQAVEQHSHFND